MLFTSKLDEAFKITKTEANAIKVFTHIDENTDLKLIEELDQYFIDNKNTPSVHQVLYTDSNSVRMSVFTDGYDTENYINYYAYLTWANTFYLRYADAYTAIGEQGKRFISPESEFNLAVYLMNNTDFKPLDFHEVI